MEHQQIIAKNYDWSNKALIKSETMCHHVACSTLMIENRDNAAVWKKKWRW